MALLVILLLLAGACGCSMKPGRATRRQASDYMHATRTGSAVDIRHASHGGGMGTMRRARQMVGR
jgi:hypothetical protein